MAHEEDASAAALLMPDQWQRQQQKTFTAWVNSQLRKRGLKVEDVQVDFCDGRLLLHLMEIVGDATLPKAARGNMRIHKAQNLNHALQFIKEKGVKLVGIGAEEIMDGNLKMILGMLWTIILRFEIQDISLEEMSAKDALLLWCQRKTAPYNNVDVSNFHMSWKDGLAFCALIHRHRPELIDYDSLRKDNPEENFRIALETADKHLDIPPMIDAQDMIECVKPDERSVMTYVAAYYKVFSSYNKNEIAAKKIATVLETNREHERLIEDYETMASNLLQWIAANVARMEERPDLNSVGDCQNKIEELNKFRADEYPPKLQEKGELEAHYSTLQTKLRLSGRPPYVPSEGKLIADIHTAWSGLEAAETSHKVWVLEELKRNQIAELKARSFNQKASDHEAWTSGKDTELAIDDYTAANLGGINALKKKHEAFQSDLAAHETRVHEIGTLANELDGLRYFDADAVNARYGSIYDTWQTLVELTEQREQNIEAAVKIQAELDQLRLDFAVKAAPFNTFLEETKDKLTEEQLYNTEADVDAQKQVCEGLKAAVTEKQADFDELVSICARMTELGASDNPYTPHNISAIETTWTQLQASVPETEANLSTEAEKQTRREQLRVSWAESAKASNEWLTTKTEEVKNIAEQADFDKMEDQIGKLQSVEAETNDYNETFTTLEDLHKEIQEALIFDNPHCSITIESLRGLWHGLSASIRRHTTEFNNQILMRDGKNITEDQLKEYRESFNHFDKNSSKKLDRLEFRGCLISLGYPIPQVPKEGEPDTEFDRVMARVDPNGDNQIAFDEFVAFMAEEQADAETSEQLLDSFKVLAGDNAYVTADQLRRDLPEELAAYCIENMTPYEGGPEGALDYQSFASALYGESDL